MISEREWLHELASPVQIISMRLEMLEESRNQNQLDRDSQACIDEAISAVDSIKKMMHLRRLEINQADPGPKQEVLVVDDDQALRETIAFDMRRRGYEVSVASGGNEAFKIIQTRQISLVISDVRMPDGDGIELLRQVRSRNHDTPVIIFVTGFADLTPEQAYDIGADAVLSKPFKRIDLFNAVENALKPRETRWKNRPERAGVDMELNLRLPGSADSRAGRVLNMGRGGMFVAFGGTLPRRGDTVRFHLDLEGEATPLCGQGMVRWARSGPTGAKPAPGFGMEFLFLEENCRQGILGLIEEHQTNAFIPAA
jgi:CheY-like chemotaxis protein